MSRTLLALLALAGCDRTPAHRPAARDAGAAPHDTRLRIVDAGAVTRRACDPHHLIIAPGRVIVRTSTGDQPIAWTDRDVAARDLAAALGRPAAGCTEVIVEPADLVPYDDVVAVMDVAINAGYVDVAIDDGLPDTAPAGTGSVASKPRPTPDQVRSAPVVIVSPTDLRIGDTVVTSDLSAPVAAATERALRATGAPRPHVILQADKSTPSRVIREVLVGARQAGYDNVLFAVNRR